MPPKKRKSAFGQESNNLGIIPYPSHTQNTQAGHNGTSFTGNVDDPSNIGHHPDMVYTNGQFDVVRSFANMGIDLEAMVQRQYAIDAARDAQLQSHESVPHPQPRPQQQQQQQHNSNPNNLGRPGTIPTYTQIQSNASGATAQLAPLTASALEDSDIDEDYRPPPVLSANRVKYRQLLEAERANQTSKSGDQGAQMRPPTQVQAPNGGQQRQVPAPVRLVDAPIPQSHWQKNPQGETQSLGEIQEKQAKTAVISKKPVPFEEFDFMNMRLTDPVLRLYGPKTQQYLLAKINRARDGLFWRKKQAAERNGKTFDPANLTPEQKAESRVLVRKESRDFFERETGHLLTCAQCTALGKASSCDEHHIQDQCPCVHDDLPRMITASMQQVWPHVELRRVTQVCMEWLASKTWTYRVRDLAPIIGSKGWTLKMLPPAECCVEGPFIPIAGKPRGRYHHIPGLRPERLLLALRDNEAYWEMVRQEEAPLRSKGKKPMPNGSLSKVQRLQ
ncbi:hypothetical protein LTR86_005870 [Recurvomyces mirabilis]|nr:hypothetical protein LTR86_005870 [Recurvomyces mirabilis]